MLRPGDCVMTGAQAVASMTQGTPQSTTLKAELLDLCIQQQRSLDSMGRMLAAMRQAIEGMSETRKSGSKLQR